MAWIAWNETFLATSRRLVEQPYTVRAQPGVPERDVTAALAALGAADRHLQDVLDVEPPHVDLKLATFSRCVPYLPLASTGSAVADDDEICVNVRRRAWPQARRDPAAATVLLAHERFHTVQGQGGCLPAPGEHEYAWWVEGSATWVGFRAAVHAGLLTDEQAAEELERWSRTEPGAGPLRAYEEAISGDGQYALAAGAVALLLERREPADLLAFCRAVGDGRPWRAAFEDAFGVPVDDFYRRFERAPGSP